MKKLLIFLLTFSILMSAAYAKKAKKVQKKILPESVMAPAVQFNSEDYKDYFKKTTDFKVNLKTFSDYKITCDKEIIGINWGDIENIKIYDEKNENNEVLDMKSTVLKTRYETYTYVRLYKATGEIVNIVLGTNSNFEENQKINLGLCQIEPYRG